MPRKNEKKVDSKEQPIESTVTQGTTDPNVSGTESSISEETLAEKNEHKIASINQDENSVVPNSDEEILNENIKQAEAANRVQSPASTEAEYATPRERSEDTKTIDDSNITEQQGDETDNDTSDLEEDSKLEKKETTLEEEQEISTGEDESIGDVAVSENNEKSQSGMEDLVDNEILTKKDKHEIALINQDLIILESDRESLNKDDDTEKNLLIQDNKHNRENGTPKSSRKVSISDGESLRASDDDSSSTKSLYVDENDRTPSKTRCSYPKRKAFKSPFANFSKGEIALAASTILFASVFIASLISSALGKPLCPDAKGNLISLVILGTVTAILIVISSAHFCCSNKSKEELSPSSALGGSKTAEVPENKKNK